MVRCRGSANPTFTTTALDYIQAFNWTHHLCSCGHLFLGSQQRCWRGWTCRLHDHPVGWPGRDTRSLSCQTPLSLRTSELSGGVWCLQPGRRQTGREEDAEVLCVLLHAERRGSEYWPFSSPSLYSLSACSASFQKLLHVFSQWRKAQLWKSA